MSDFVMQLHWWNQWKTYLIKSKFQHPIVEEQYRRAAMLAYTNYVCYEAQYNKGGVKP